MKITKSQLRKIIKEEFNSEADSIARDQAGQIGQENYDILDKVGDALVTGGDATNWVLDNDEWQSLIVPTSDADMPEFIEAIETVLSNNLGMSIKQLLGLKENKMKITKTQLRKMIKEEIQKSLDESSDKMEQLGQADFRNPNHMPKTPRHPDDEQYMKGWEGEKEIVSHRKQKGALERETPKEREARRREIRRQRR